ncbi:MAG TPA: hypothetical protein VEY90_02375, partial [Thermoleophilaceae bacterium]|nr:hypothetical protein [Thermoleophilaceae bacterium]
HERAAESRRARAACLRDPLAIEGGAVLVRCHTRVAIGYGEGESAAELLAGAGVGVPQPARALPAGAPPELAGDSPYS